MNANRSLIAVLLLVLAAGAWLFLRDDPPAPAEVAGTAEATADLDAGTLSRPADPAAAELQREQTGGVGLDGDAAGALAATPAGKARLTLRATDARGDAVAAAWASARPNPIGDDGDLPFFAGGLAGEPEGERVAASADGRVELSVPAGSALVLTVGGAAAQTRTLRLDPLARGERLDLGEVALKDGGALAGRVVDPDGAGIAGAAVALRPEGRPGFGGFDSPRALTDARGEFRMEGLAPGIYALDASASGFAPAEQARATIEAGVDPAEAVLRLREGRVVRGQVVDRDRRPVAGAEIFVRSNARGGPLVIEFGGAPGGAQEADAVSGADGRFTLRGLPDDTAARLTARAEGYASGRAAVEPAASEVLITLTPALRLAGRILDADGAGVAGLDVAVERADDEFDFRSFWNDRSTVTGADGGFAIEGLDAGVWRVLAQTATHSVGDARVDLARDVDDFLARLAPASLFSMRVTDAATGDPIVGANVSLAPQDEEAGFAGPGEVRREVRIRAGGGPPQISFGGDEHATTDGDGVAVFRELAEGRYTASVHAEGYARQQAAVVRGRGPQQQELALLPGSNLRAYVFDGAGLPLPSVRVLARPADAESGAAPLARTSDASGRAVFSGMLPGAWKVDYEAAALEGAMRFTGFGEPVPAAGAAESATAVEVMLTPGLDAEVRLDARGLALPTVAVTRRGRPLAGAAVRVEPAQETDDPMAGMRFGFGGGETTDASGRVRLQPVEPGEYEVVVTPGGGLPERRERATLSAGEQTIAFDVRGGTIAGFAESDAGILRGAVAHLERVQPQGGVRTRMTFAFAVDSGDGASISTFNGPPATRCEVDPSGRFVFEEVPPGEWTVRVTAPGHAAWTSPPVALADREERDVGTARLSAGGVLRGVHRGALSASEPGFGSILILLDADGRQVGIQQPRPDGSFEFRDLAAGSYTLRAPPGYRSDPIEVGAGATVSHDVPAER